MKDLFRKAGRVLHTDVHSNPGSRAHNGNGTVIFEDPYGTKAAIGKHPHREASSSNLK